MPAHDVEHVRAVLGRHRSDITTRYRAIGTGIGHALPPDEGYAIVVYLEREEHRPAGAVVIEDVPVRFEITGRIRPLGK
jgi:hypothetical protein